jgi:RNase P subunit RPR2
MTPETLTELQWRGITPPPPHSQRTTCPYCSHGRVKSHKRCFRIIEHDDHVRLECKHCGFEDTFSP